MNANAPLDDVLLAKYIAGEAVAAERAQVEAWADADPAHAAELERMRTVWHYTADGTDLPAVDTDAAWHKVNARIAAERPAARVIPLRRWLAAAAVLVGLVFAARWWLAPPRTTYLADTSYRTVRLADSSAVVLSPGTRLTASIAAHRAVTLHGEAYFDVHRDAAHPFVIDAAEMEVTVRGTAFTVTAYDTSRVLLVRVREGRVQVVAGPDTLLLTAGQHARFDRARHVLERQPAPPMEVWGTRILQFEDAPLADVVAQLQQRFAVRIVLGNTALARCRLTATFEDEPVERILDVIAQTFGLTVARAPDNRYTLSGNGCDR